MKVHTPTFDRPNVRTFIANFLVYLLLTSQLAPMAMAAGSRRVPKTPKESSEKSEKTDSLNVAAVPAPLVVAPSLTATKTDNFVGVKNPGDTIDYTITITNTGDQLLQNVTLNDTVDPNTTIVPGSTTSTPIAFADTFSAVGNVRIQVPDGASDLLANDIDPDTGNNTGLTITTLAGDNSAPFAGTSTGNGQVTATTGDGSFQYNPAPGFTGSDTFTYIVTDAQGKTSTATVTITVTGMIWFVDPAAATGGDGRLTTPFNCYTGTTGAQTCFSDTAADDPGDNIFLFTGSHTGGYGLLNNERLIGQGASATLATIAGVTVPTFSDALPVTNGNPATVSIATSVAATNAVNLGAGNSNTLRGFTIGNTTGAKVASTAAGFGTLTASEVILNGNGQALNLDSGALAATFVSISSNASGTQGIILDQVSGSLASTGGTTITDPVTQCVLVTASTADINFGNTSCTLATDGISLQNNSAGTRTFGTLSVTGATGVGFLHSVGGGAVNVTGATSITNPAGVGIDVDSSNANLSFAATTVDKSSTSGIGVDLTNNATRTIAFTSLAVTTSNGVSLNTNNSGTVNSGGGSLTATGTGGAASLTNTALGLTFTSVSSNGGANGVIINSGGSGTFVSGTTNLQNNAGIGLLMSASGVAANFGNTTVNSSAGDAVDLSSNTANITFADLDLTPDSSLRGLDAQNNTGTITSTSGDIATTGGVAVFIDGPAGRTPLAMVLNNVDSTNALAEGINIREASGSFAVNDATLATNIVNPTGIGISVLNSTATFNFGNSSVTGSGGTSVVLGGAGAGNTGAITFADLDITPDSGQRAFHAVQNTGAITTTSGTLSTTNQTDVEIVGTSAGSRTPLNIQFTSVSALASGGNPPNGIILTNTSASGSPGGFRVLGSGGTCTFVTPTCTGGRIQSTTGAEDISPEDNPGIGVRLNNANQVFLTRMRIDNHANFAVHGTNVIGLNIDSCVLDGNNGTNPAFEEGAIGLRELTGTAGAGTASSITNSFIGGGREFLIDLRNFNGGTLDRLSINNNTIGDLDGAGAGFGVHVSDGDDAIHLEGFGTGATFNVTANNNSFNSGRGDVVNFNVGTGGNNPINSDFVFRNNSVTNTHPAILSGGGGMTVTMGGGATVNSTYDISCNKFSGAKGFGLLVAKTLGSGTAQGTIFNNRFGTDGVVNSSSSEASGIDVDARGAGTHTVLIKNNIVNNWGANGAIQLFNNQGSSVMNATVIGNTSNNPDAEGLAGLYAEVGALAGDTNVMNIKVGGSGAEENNFVEGDFFNANDVLISRIAGGGTVMNLSRGVSAASNVQQIITDNNVDPVTAAGAGTVTFVNTLPTLPPATDQTCSPPAAPETGTFALMAVPAATQQQSTTSAPSTVATAPATTAPVKPEVVSSTTASTGGVQLSAAKQNSGAMLRYSPTNTAAPLVAPVAAQPQEVQPQTEDTPTANPPVIVGDNITWNIGELPVGASVTITFQVTIDNPFTGPGQVSNQGTVTSTTGALNVLTDDPDVAGPNNPTVTLVNAPPDAFVRDASVAEPTSGSANMLFTVALSVPAPGTVSVNFTTNPGGANPATPGTDYTTTSGTVTFQTGERLKTIAVPVLADADNAETDETLLLDLSTPVGLQISDGQATGTITVANPAGTFLISEIRTSGPGGLGDDFVEVYNNSNSPLTITASDASAGYGLFKMGSTCDATPILIGTIPNGTIIPARGHYLFVGSQYSLTNYGGSGAAAGNLTLSSDIETDANVAIFSTSEVGNLSSVNRLDAVGFALNTGGNCDLLREGNILPSTGSTILEGSYQRDQCGKLANPTVFGGCPTGGLPKDSNSNAQDLFWADTAGTNTPAGQHLGAPGPENITNPINRNSTFAVLLVDATVSAALAPNRVRDFTVVPNGASGTLTIRRRYRNDTGGAVTRLRFRIVDISTLPTPGGVADMRALTSTSVVVTTNDSQTCTAAGAGPPPCSVTVEGTTLETPPNQAIGGGNNSTLSVGVITLATPLANGASVNLQWTLGLQTTGSFKFLVNVEALP